eukprot:939798-Pelagomonas_calceolata.AAC.4
MVPDCWPASHGVFQKWVSQTYNILQVQRFHVAIDTFAFAKDDMVTDPLYAATAREQKDMLPDCWPASHGIMVQQHVHTRCLDIVMNSRPKTK